jgi:acetaldehyde dehydrogenase/alcohol dehydrogenase
MAFANGFLGACHGISHTLGALHHVEHGRMNSLLLPYTIRYNATTPVKPTSWPKYDHYTGGERTIDVAKHLDLPHSTVEEATDALAEAVIRLRSSLGVENSLQEVGVEEEVLMSGLDRIALRAYEDQCTPANPRVPLLDEIKDISTAVFYGCSIEEGRQKRIAWEEAHPQSGE